MVPANNSHLSIHVTLKKLINEKSKRDNVKFTACQLAHALNMPRSIITKLTHTDNSKRVTNPRIDTLIKIVDFFRADGFNVTLEDLIGMKSNTIDINEQNLLQQTETSVSIYSLDNVSNEKIGSINIKISTKSKNVFGLYANQDIEPFFKKGSIFIIDPDAQIESDNLIAIKTAFSTKIQIRKYLLEKNKVILKSFNPDEKNIILMPTTQCEVIGVVIQVNAKT